MSVSRSFEGHADYIVSLISNDIVYPIYCSSCIFSYLYVEDDAVFAMYVV